MQPVILSLIRLLVTLAPGAELTMSWCLSTAITQREKVEVKLSMSGRKVETQHRAGESGRTHR